MKSKNFVAPLDAQLKIVGCGAVLLLPFFLTHFRGGAEVIITLTSLLFLLHSTLTASWGWIKQPIVVVMALWWLWGVICSLPVRPIYGGQVGSFFQSLVVVRFLLFVVAMQVWLLVSTRMQTLLKILLCVCCAYIVGQILFQAIFGVNFFGQPRYFDGTLTGPYTKPRAAAPLSRLLLPVLLLACSAWWQKVDDKTRHEGNTSLLVRLGTGAGMIVLLAGGCTVMALAGQRMPFLLFGLGVFIAALWISQLRWVVGVLAVLVPVILAGVYYASPGSFQHLVILFENQISHFSSSHYARIYARTWQMIEAYPWLGIGFDGFRYECANPAYWHDMVLVPTPVGNGGGAEICVQHPHNHYLEALSNAGWPGLLLFGGMVVSWLVVLAKGLAALPRQRIFSDKKAWGVGIFAAVFIQEWPIASTSSFVNMPLGGWFFLLLAMGMAEFAPISTTRTSSPYGRQRNERLEE
ncbi:O-antigen ligase family protein [Entomobacter blattae]|uniref:O-Antigen ligase n=1 Tax=Entomobacter blattae TaxID=2762277 RepID=A0A7H1NQT0_9PROT|nr:O-antigen ligase family protein [Entomobacter blattae]QNT78140.1 O-Antigen ligase [Entomobacter blattae]